MVVPYLEMDGGTAEQPCGDGKQQPAQIDHEMMAEEVEVDRNAERDQAPSPRMVRKSEIEQPPGAAEIAADAGIHEAGEQRHAADAEEIRLRINPGPGLRLEDLHRRSDEVIDQDHLRLV